MKISNNHIYYKSETYICFEKRIGARYSTAILVDVCSIHHMILVSLLVKNILEVCRVVEALLKFRD